MPPKQDKKKDQEQKPEEKYFDPNSERYHYVMCNNKGEARDRARNASNHHQPPIHHPPHKKNDYGHYHAAGPDGKQKDDGVHYQYP